MDRRRRRWIAFDVSFFDKSVGLMLRERFGPTGITVFLAFLCACKRNLVPGQIEYGTEADFLGQIGLPDLPLVNEKGEEWTLDALWRSLADHKQITRRARGRLTQVRSSKWEEWQEDFTREAGAEKKRRSRATNTETIPGRYPDDTAPLQRRKLPETDRETDIDLPPPTPSAAPNGCAPVQDEEEEGSTIKDTVKIIAERELRARLSQEDKLGPVADRSAWLASARRKAELEHRDRLEELAAEGLSPSDMADAVRPLRAAPPAPYVDYKPRDPEEPVVAADVALSMISELKRASG